MAGSEYFECGSCGKAFPAGWRARENHCNSTGHGRPDHECNTCQRWFYSDRACEQHMDAVGHWGQSDSDQSESDDEDWECSQCARSYRSEHDVLEHEREDHLYCRPCNRDFCDDNAINMHLRSRVHRGTNVPCPFCNGTYVTATGLAHHLETGSCPQAHNLDRDQIYRMLRAVDRQGVMTKNLIGWYGSDKYEASGLAWNGDCYECYLCHRGFSSLHGLNQHLSSPVHQQALYHCPKSSCGQDFRSIAGLINHLESETCGFMRFADVQQRAQDMMRGGRLLAY